MTEKELVQGLNYLLESFWTKKDLEVGKVYRVSWDDICAIKTVIPMYVDRGWIIKKEALLLGGSRDLLLYVLKPIEYH
jgi:hypothetical protein